MLFAVLFLERCFLKLIAFVFCIIVFNSLEGKICLSKLCRGPLYFLLCRILSKERSHGLTKSHALNCPTLQVATVVCSMFE